jgi:hypothetical protein
LQISATPLRSARCSSVRVREMAAMSVLGG